MLILALDTASSFCSVALAENGIVTARHQENIGKGHAEHLLPQIAALMRESKHKFAQLAYIAVNIGPGSFTGVRVGVAAARAMSLAIHKPAVGITAFAALRLQALAEFGSSNHAEKIEISAAPKASPAVCVILKAAQNSFYWQYFAPDGTPDTPQNSTAETAATALQRHMRQSIATQSSGKAPRHIIFIGSGAEQTAALLPHSSTKNNAQLHILSPAHTADITFFAEAAYASIKNDTAALSLAPEPLYLRAANAKPQAGTPLYQVKTQFRTSPKRAAATAPAHTVSKKEDMS